MYAEILAVVSIAVAITAVIISASKIQHAKKQITEMSEALEDIRNGNGNRRILSTPHELAAPIAWQINELVRSYEDRLSVCRRAEETNRQLMTSLSHDVRTPLTTLIGYLDAVHRGIVIGEEREDYLKTARRKAYDLKEYIDELFDWFKLGSDEFSMNLTAAELTEVTRNILIDWIPIFEDRQLEYKVEIPEMPFRVMLDPDGYLRIVNNLIQNVLAHSRADWIEIALSERNGEAALCIRDNGIGIREEDLKHIFDRLYKCDRGRSQKGSGLGLAIVRQLTEKMGGKIHAESTPGTGTEFTVTFPLKERKTEKQEPF